LYLLHVYHTYETLSHLSHHVYAGTNGTNNGDGNAAVGANNNNNNHNMANGDAADDSTASAEQKAVGDDSSSSSNKKDRTLNWLDATLTNAGYSTAVTLKLLTVDKLITVIPCLSKTPRDELQSLLDTINTGTASIVVPDEQAYDSMTQWLKAYDTDMSDDDYIAILNFMQVWLGRLQSAPHRRLASLQWHHFDKHNRRGPTVKLAYRELLILAADKQRVDSIFKVCAAAGLKRRREASDGTNEDVYILKENTEAEHSGSCIKRARVA
jgi:hypothetical protein